MTATLDLSHSAPLSPTAFDDARPSSLQETAPLPAAPPGAGDPAGGAPPAGGGGLSGFLPFIVIGAVFWFLIIGPERKNRKKRELMLTALKKGDRVMTTGGMYGRVTELRDDTVTLDAGDVRLKFSRSAIQGVIEGDEAKDAKA